MTMTTAPTAAEAPALAHAEAAARRAADRLAAGSCAASTVARSTSRRWPTGARSPTSLTPARPRRGTPSTAVWPSLTPAAPRTSACAPSWTAPRSMTGTPPWPPCARASRSRPRSEPSAPWPTRPRSASSARSRTLTAETFGELAWALVPARRKLVEHAWAELADAPPKSAEALRTGMAQVVWALGLRAGGHAPAPCAHRVGRPPAGALDRARRRAVGPARHRGRRRGRGRGMRSVTVLAWEPDEAEADFPPTRSVCGQTCRWRPARRRAR